MRLEVKQYLKDLRGIKGFEDIKASALEEVKNQMANKIISSEDAVMEDRARELKYRVATILWLFDIYLENEVKPKVDKKK